MSDSQITALGLVAIALLLLAVVSSFAMLAGMWKIFGKAGRKRWLALVPLYNNWVLYEVAGKPGWWSLGGFLPVVGWVVAVVMSLGLAPKFGRSTAFAVFMAFVPPAAFLILGFGKAQYEPVQQ